MKYKTVKAVLFVASMLVCALIAWVGGFNFDERGDGAAVGLCVSLWVSLCVAMFSTEAPCS